MAKTTRRRKVWVNEFVGRFGGLGLRAWASLKMAQRDVGRTEWDGPVKAVCFVEARPGDVVLSREDRDRLLTLVDETAREEGRDSEREALIVSLLRGGR